MSLLGHPESQGDVLCVTSKEDPLALIPELGEARHCPGLGVALSPALSPDEAALLLHWCLTSRTPPSCFRHGFPGTSSPGCREPGLCRKGSFPLREHWFWGRGVPAKQDPQLRSLQHFSQQSTAPVPDGPGKGSWSGVVQMDLASESVRCCPACCAVEHSSLASRH